MLKAGQIVSIKVGNDTFDATVASDGELVLPDRIGDNNEVVISYETKVADYDAVIPQITGSAYLTGESTYVIDPDDPLKYGFKVGR